MVQLSILSIASVAVFASFGAAKNCQTQFSYCTSALLTRGNYYSMIEDVVGKSTIPGITMDNALFECLSDETGDISIIQACPGNCVNGGDGFTDRC